MFLANPSRVIALLVSGLVVACAEPPLNSEQILERYGSYGVELVEQDAARRVTSLYSLKNGRRVCRSYALVLFEPLDPSLDEADRAIRAGGSIGASFAGRGWQVHKANVEMGAIAVDSGSLAALMSIDVPAVLALHVYSLSVERDGLHLPYATIAEIHHPDYLSLSDLRRLYGRLPDAENATAERARVRAELREVLAD